MHPSLDFYLTTKYPDLFKNRHASMQVTAMCWGFDCGDGWFYILDNLCSGITSYCKRNKIEMPIVQQVKEKFGSLRFYLDHTKDDTISELIRFAENMTFNTCEKCGALGKLHKNGVVFVSCDKCKDKSWIDIKEEWASYKNKLYTFISDEKINVLINDDIYVCKVIENNLVECLYSVYNSESVLAGQQLEVEYMYTPVFSYFRKVQNV